MLTPAFVIHSRPYRETSQLVEVFTQDSGRFTLVGPRGRRAPAA
ncbi:recombination protein O N-terminal domain-containing protein, partial [Aeromonas aquatilis]